METPKGWTFANFYGESSTQCIGLMYTSTMRQGILSINQCKTAKVSDISAFPPRSIERVNVGSGKGQYIAGGFVIAENGKQVWDSTPPIKQLYWQGDGIWMQVAVYGSRAFLMEKEDLIAIAESLK